jgi:hypothetical protein
VIEKPENLIPRDKMVDILFDLSLINAGKAIDPIVMQESQIEPMSYVFSKYEIDSAQFVQSDLYYAAIPLEYEAIYEAVKERLEAEKARLQEEKDKDRDTTGYQTPVKLPVKVKQ